MFFSSSRLIAVAFCAITAVSAVPHQSTPSATPVRRQVPSKRAETPASPSKRAPRPEPSFAKRAPAPQPSAAKRHAKRSVEDQLPIIDVSFHLCPNQLKACPIAASGSMSSLPQSLKEWETIGYECVAVEEDLTSCGGCASIDASHDCTSISNALNMSCNIGKCQVHTCATGFIPSEDGLSCVRA